LSERDQQVIECLIEGIPLSRLARKRGCCNSTLIQRKQSLAKAIAEYMGLSILVDIQRQPRWKDSLNASKERLAVRYERNH
jgi:hypothetical protein